MLYHARHLPLIPLSVFRQRTSLQKKVFRVSSHTPVLSPLPPRLPPRLAYSSLLAPYYLLFAPCSCTPRPTTRCPKNKRATPTAAFVSPAALAPKGSSNAIHGAAQSSGFASTSSRPAAAVRPRRAGGDAGGVRGLKAVTMTESTDVVSPEGSDEDKMGEYIKSRGGSLPIRKVCFAFCVKRYVSAFVVLVWFGLVGVYNVFFALVIVFYCALRVFFSRVRSLFLFFLFYELTVDQIQNQHLGCAKEGCCGIV